MLVKHLESAKMYANTCQTLPKVHLSCNRYGMTVNVMAIKCSFISCFWPKHFYFRPHISMPKLAPYFYFTFPYSLVHEYISWSHGDTLHIFIISKARFVRSCRTAVLRLLADMFSINFYLTAVFNQTAKFLGSRNALCQKPVQKLFI